MTQETFFYAAINKPKTGNTNDFIVLFDENLQPAGILKTARSIVDSKEDSPFKNNQSYRFEPYTVTKSLLSEKGVVTFTYLVINDNKIQCKPIFSAGMYENKDISIIREVVASDKLSSLIPGSRKIGIIKITY